MAIKTRLQAHGIVQSVSTRSGEKDGTAWTLTNVLIIGDGTICDATLARGVNSPAEGTEVHALVEVDVFRQSDAVTIVRWLDDTEVDSSSRGGK